MTRNEVIAAYLIGILRTGIPRYLQNGGCSNCGGVPHTSTCMVGALAKCLEDFGQPESAAPPAPVEPPADLVALVQKWQHYRETWDSIGRPSYGEVLARMNDAAAEVLEWTPAALAPPATTTSMPPQVIHGKTCPKVAHSSFDGGYMHAESDDSPFDLDGVSYCGRCHEYLANGHVWTREPR